MFGAGLLIVALLANLRPTPAEARSSPGLVKIGLAKTLFRGTPDSVIQVVMRPFKSLLESQTGVTGQIISAGDSNDLAKQLAADKVQLGVFHGFEFAWAKQKYPELEPLVIALHHHAELRACLVVRTDSKADSYADLEGKIIALPVQTREHCRLFFERKCVRPGLSAKKFYREMTDPDDADEALHDVFEKKAAAAVVDAVAFEEFKEKKTTRGKQLKALADSGPLPCAVVAYKKDRFDADLVGRFRTALLSAKDTRSGQKMLEMIRITSFARVPTAFDKQVSDTLVRYPPPPGK